MSTFTSNPIAAALRELIRLKDLKTDANNINTSGDWEATRRRRAMLEEHDAKKGEAWDAARRALHAFDSDSHETFDGELKIRLRGMLEWITGMSNDPPIVNMAKAGLDFIDGAPLPKRPAQKAEIFPCSHLGCKEPDGSKCRHWPRGSEKASEGQS